jgi:hypothetical protein
MDRIEYKRQIPGRGDSKPPMNGSLDTAAGARPRGSYFRIVKRSSRKIMSAPVSPRAERRFLASSGVEGEAALGAVRSDRIK